MLVVGVWVSLLIYIISWIFSLFASPFEKNKDSIFSQFEVFGMRIAWIIHTLTLLGILWTKSVWPTSFVSDILSITAWVSMVCVQAFPERLPSLFNEIFIRLFVILLLGLSLIISQKKVISGEIFFNQTWLYEVLLVSHIIILLAGYVLLGVACVASMIFLYQERHLKKKNVNLITSRFPALSTLDRLSWQGTLCGFLALSIGIMIGILIKNNDQSLLANLRFLSSISAWFVFALLLLFKKLQILDSFWASIWPIFGFILALISLIVELLRLNVIK